MKQRAVLMIWMFPFLLKGWAQESPLLQYQPGTSQVQVSSMIHTGSNFFTLQKYFDLRGGGHLTSGLLKEIELSLGKQNRVGGMYDYEWMGIHGNLRCLGNDSIYFVTAAGYHEFQELSFTKSAALVAMYGNLQFEGDTVDIGPFNFQMQKYHQWKAGMMKVSSRARGKFYAGFTFGISLGLQQMHINVDQARLFTAPYGEQVSLYTSMQFSRSAPEPFGAFRVQGVGPALDFFYAWVPVKGPSLSLSFTQLGFIMWNEKSYAYTRDSTLRFDGVEIENIFNTGNQLDQPLNPDTLDKLFNRVGEPSKHYTSLPLTLHIAAKQTIPGMPLTVRGSFLYRHQTLMRPRLEFAVDWQILSWLTLTRSYHIGGYAAYGTGFGAQFRLRQSWHVEVGANDLYRFFSAQEPLNIHGYLGIRYRPAIKNISMLP
jgi:hypothetical protein